MADQDPTISGVTLIMPNGDMYYIDADRLRKGGKA
jgi:hypothetical protein